MSARTLARTAIVICALALAGCGGGGGGGDVECTFFSSTCNPVVGSPSFISVGITPLRITAQVGTAVTFNADAVGLTNPIYAWCRRPSGGGTCTPMPSVVGPSFTIASVALADDGARFEVTATGPEGRATSLIAKLAVSSMPGVVYADGEFLESEWAVSATVTPTQNGPIFTATRATEGGHPGAFRSATYDFPSRQPGLVRIFHTRLREMYSPASQGAIHVIDFAEDCLTTSLTFVPYLVPLLEQGGRRFMANGFAEGACRNWSTRRHSSLSREAFVQIDGPACNASESCPDFSGTGAPIHLGVVGVGELVDIIPSTVTVPAPSSLEFDNWTATVWRK